MGMDAGRTNWVYFDLETQRSAEEVGGWENISKMGLAMGVTYNTREQCFRAYEEEDVAYLIDELRRADRVIGFNLIRFDYTVLAAYTDAALQSLPTLDLLAYLYPILGFRPRLDGLAMATLNERKSADGLASLRWYRAGEFAKIALYCKEDVRITRDLHEYGRRYGHVCYLDRKGTRQEVKVDW